MRKKDLFTAGEFAELCNTTKETLFHYDRIGILKPVQVGENNYRYYSPRQFYDYDLIVVLKEAGSSLKEIKSYIEKKNPQDFLDMLQSKRELLEKERKKIEHLETVLKNAVNMTTYALTESYEIPAIKEMEEEYFIVEHIPQKENLSLIEEVVSMRDHFLACQQFDQADEYPVGSIILKETLDAGKFYDSYYYSKVSEPVDSDQLFVKPAGTYAVILHHGNYQTILHSYEKAKSFIEAEGFSICGNAYEYELLSYLATGDSGQYVIQLAIQVEKK